LICTTNPLLILDLSIPKNVDDNVKELSNVTLVHLDELSQITTKALSDRENHIPRAQEIITDIYAEFKQWMDSRRFAPTMQALKSKLDTLKDAEIKSNRTKFEDFNQEQVNAVADRIIQKIAGHFANHLRNEDESTDEAITMLNKVFKLEEHNY